MQSKMHALNIHANFLFVIFIISGTTLAGVCGLRNLGNTCFMAAGLQCLTATPPVLRHFLDLQQLGEKLPPPGSLMAHFSLLLSQMWSGRHSVIKPTEFKHSLGAYHSQFKDYRQVIRRRSDNESLFQLIYFNKLSVNIVVYLFLLYLVIILLSSMIVKSSLLFSWILYMSK